MNKSGEVRSQYGKRWLWIRMVLMALGGITGPSAAKGFMEIPVSECLLICCVFLVIPSLGLSFLVLTGKEKWLRPSWYRNPFSFHDPVQVAHWIAFETLATGVGACYLLFTVGLIAAPYVCVFFSMGAGCWLALHLCMTVFRKKFVGPDLTPSS